jgi:hypothetical protein
MPRHCRQRQNEHIKQRQWKCIGHVCSLSAMLDPLCNKMINTISPLFGTERLSDWRHREMNAERLECVFSFLPFLNERQPN